MNHTHSLTIALELVPCTQRPRNEEAIREKMISMMKKAKFVPSGQTASHVDYGMDTMLLFDEFVDMAMVRRRAAL